MKKNRRHTIFHWDVVAPDGRTQERNQISQGRVGYRILHRKTDVRKQREKPGTDGRTVFHAHGKEQIKNPLFFGFPSTR